MSPQFGPVDAGLLESIGVLVGGAMTRRCDGDLPEADARPDSHIDALTGLMNQAAISARLVDVCNGTDAINAVLIGIDGFTAVNDALGHRSGDTVLQEIAARLERSIGVDDHLGRVGGDRFLLLTEQDEPADFAERMIGHVEETILVDSELVQLSASAGITQHRSGDTAADLLERADHLMSMAKAAGRGQVRSDTRVDDDSTRLLHRPFTLDGAVGLDQVDEAIDGLRVVVQPIIDVFTGRLHGVEALARGPHGHVLEFPDRLFPAAATFGRLAELELEAKRLAFELPLDDEMMLYVNLEPVLLADSEWMSKLTDAWKSSSKRPSVTAELTERSVLTSPGRLLQAVEACREFGWRIALDDVGSRSESLAALRWIDPDIVKLDMSLISGRRSAHTARVASAVASHRNLREAGAVQVIAEGVETASDVLGANVLGVDYLQGYLLGRPVDIDELRPEDSRQPHEFVSSTPRSGGERLATKRQLLAMTRDVEASVLSADAILVASIQRASTLSPPTCRLYERLARRCAFVGMVGAGLTSIDTDRLHGVRRADVEPGDELLDSWQVITLSPITSLGLVATEVAVEPQPTDLDRLFSYRFITDPTEVEEAARRLLYHF